MVRNAGYLRQYHPDVMAALRNSDSKQLLHGHTVAHVIDQWGDIVEPIRVGHHAVIVHSLRHLFKAAVEVPDLHVRVYDLFPIEFGYDSNDPVHGGVRGTYIEEHLPGLYRTRGCFLCLRLVHTWSN